MKRESLLFVAILLFGVLFTTNAHSALLNIDSITGQLLGASGVSVNNKLYDVEFIDNTAVSIWGSTNYQFTFTTDALAISASQALLDEVFIDTTGQAFDSNPGLTAGIATESIFGAIATPYSNSSGWLNIEYARNEPTGGNDSVINAAGWWHVNDNFVDNGVWTYAVWSETSSVPIPSTLVLFGFGVLGLLGIERYFQK